MMSSHEFPWIGVSVIGGMIFCWIAISITIVLYKRRVNRLNWLNRLERFKSEHIYAAYMKNKCDMENPAPDEEDEADLWEMHWDQVILSSVQLGKGVYGEVYKGKLTSLPKWASAEVNKPRSQSVCKITTSQGTEIAIKMLPMHAYEKYKKKSFLREIEIMKQLANGHRCLVHMVGCMTKPNTVLGLVLEYCPEGNLLEYVRKLGKQELENPIEIGKNAQKFARFAWQIADGMIFLASKNLVHRDLAARNVLLDSHMIARICDFGLCISAVDTKSETSTTENNEQQNDSKVEEGEKMKMPIRWMAPESLEFQHFSEKSDVWSFGVLLHELYSFGKNPFESIEHGELLNRIKEGYSPEKLELCPDPMFEIMQNCLNLNAEVRPSFTRLQIELTTFLEANNNIDYGYLALN